MSDSEAKDWSGLPRVSDWTLESTFFAYAALTMHQMYYPKPPHADAIVVFTGNGYDRAPWAAELYRQELAPIIVVAGEPGPGTLDSGI